jgi:hypothetical protein
MAGFLPAMKAEHQEAFRGAANLYNVFILVRRTNSASLKYIGDPTCVPKRLDCKAKTADLDISHPQFGPKQVAGLVVDPHIAGRDAFLTHTKYRKALDEWQRFAGMIDSRVTTLEGQRQLVYVPNGGFYFVDLDPASPRYGCVKFTINSVIAAGRYVHGDFDLYGIIRADDPSRNVAVREERLDQTHARSPEFFDVQHYVNQKLRVPMVLHGAHESYSETHENEGIDVFHPDGTVTGAENAAEIASLYENVFEGRRLFTKNGPCETDRGFFITPA